MINPALMWVKISLAVNGNEFCGGGAGDPSPRIRTAIGCVPVKFDELIRELLPYLFGIAGGISFLLMVYGFILWATSEGDLKKIAGGQETVTSAIKGLLFCIFGLFILRLIAVDILVIPGISK